MNNKSTVIKKVNKLIFVDNLELSFNGNILENPVKLSTGFRSKVSISNRIKVST